MGSESNNAPSAVAVIGLSAMNMVTRVGVVFCNAQPPGVPAFVLGEHSHLAYPAVFVLVDQDHLLACGHVVAVVAGVDALHDFKRGESESRRRGEQNHQHRCERGDTKAYHHLAASLWTSTIRAGARMKLATRASTIAVPVSTPKWVMLLSDAWVNM